MAADPAHPVCQSSWLSAFAGADVDRLSGKDFERCLAAMFNRLGYIVELTEYFDRGADLIVIRDGVKTAVQAKRSESRIGDRAVQAVSAGRLFYGCDAAMVVTNDDFQPRTRQLAKSNGVVLWNREQLQEGLLATNMIVDPPVMLAAPECAHCHIPLVRRDGRGGPFWGCRNYPRGCRSAFPIRLKLQLLGPMVRAA